MHKTHVNETSELIDRCGIEVSAEELVVGLRRPGEGLPPWKAFPNTPAGHQQIVRYLAWPGRRVRVCRESTGVYGRDLALALAKSPGLEVLVANPRAVRHFAVACMQRSKNDRRDAEVLVEFAARMPFRPWQPPSPAALQLHALARRLAALTERQTAEKNRWHAAQVSEATPVALRRDLERSLRSLRRATHRLTREAVKVIESDDGLRLRFQLLRSAQGIAQTRAVQILAELAVLASDLSVRQWVAHAGLDPRQHSSGTSVHKKTRIRKVGNRQLRRALYMPALVAVRRQPHFRAFYQHLLARGKTKMQALVAAMRKLLHAIYGMFRSQQPFDGSKVYRLVADVPAAELAFSPAEAR